MGKKDAVSCAENVQKQHYEFLTNELMDLPKEDHFWKLLEMKSQIEESVSVLMKSIDSGECDMDIVLKSLDALALVVVAYINTEKGTWDFDDLLDDKTFLQRIRQNDMASRVQPILES